MKALLRYLRMKNERPKPSRVRANGDYQEGTGILVDKGKIMEKV